MKHGQEDPVLSEIYPEEKSAAFFTVEMGHTVIRIYLCLTVVIPIDRLSARPLKFQLHLERTKKTQCEVNRSPQPFPVDRLFCAVVNQERRNLFLYARKELDDASRIKRTEFRIPFFLIHIVFFHAQSGTARMHRIRTD